ncbi:dual specificity protein phosphatase family protein [Vacuolonema iberomarrocanum]|uniref:dual specificity protein phosphatase family protein n=1 Tax=Vacuolonema iberomarrocanum TaxID=3454632 RepID=UPI003F6DBB56
MSTATSGAIAHFINTQPSLFQGKSLFMLEFFGASVTIASPHLPEALHVQIWTNALTKHNSEGDWHPIDLSFQTQTVNGHSIFEGGFRPTSEGCFRYTYRVGLHAPDPRWRWAGLFHADGRLDVKPPSPNARWTQGPNHTEVMPSIFVGNFIAASQAEKLGFDAVLNLAEELTVTYPPTASIAYKKLGTTDGAQHPIAEPLLLNALRWINEQQRQGKQRILLHCRAGIGRSGSLGVAYCFQHNPTWSYDQTLSYVWSKKPDIYPHRHLQETLERLFPRVS